MEEREVSYSEAIEKQRAYLKHYSTPEGVQDFYSRHSRPGHESRIFHRATVTALTMADPYYWNGEMCEFLTLVSEEMPRWTLRREALPTDFGFCWFSTPLALPLEAAGEAATLTAFSWGLWTSEGLDARQNLIVSAYAQANRRDGRNVVTPFMSFGWQPGTSMDVDDLDVGPSTARMDRANKRVFRYVAAALALIEQRILVTSSERPERSARRRLEKDRKVKIPDILVVRLRRSSQDRVGPSEPVEWSCRWLVRGHWRQQYYPSTGEYKPIFIFPHVKGPDDKPFRTPAERVFAMVR